MVDEEVLDYEDPRFGVSPQQEDTELEACFPSPQPLMMPELEARLAPLASAAAPDRARLARRRPTARACAPRSSQSRWAPLSPHLLRPRGSPSPAPHSLSPTTLSAEAP